MRLSLLTLLACAWSIHAQPGRSYLIDTVAGTIPDDDGVPANSAFLNISALTLAPDGNIYVVDTFKGVRKIGLDGTISRVPGASTTVGAGIAVSRIGIIYCVFGLELYTYDPVSATTTTSRPTFGPASGHLLNSVAVDQEGNAIVADRQSRQIYRVTPSGVVTLVAGLYSGVALTGRPLGVAVDSTNAIYVLSDNTIVRISPQGLVTPIAGNGEYATPAVGRRALDSGFVSLTAVTVSASGEVYFGDSIKQSIYKVDHDGVLRMVASNVCVWDMAVNDTGVVFFRNLCAAQIQRVEADGSIAAFAGRNQFDGDGGPATNALLRAPEAVVADATGSLLIGDTGNGRVRKVSPEGLIETIAGNGQSGVEGDGVPALEAQIGGPYLMAIDSENNVYFTDRGRPHVRRIRRDGIVETVAGSGNFGDSGDGGPATAATFQSIDGLAVDREGRVFISDWRSNRIRVVNRDGTIQPYAGNGRYGYVDEGALATGTALANPTRIAIDPEGNLVFFESSVWFRRVDKLGIITTYPFVKSGDDPGRCSFTQVAGLAFDVDGSLLVLGGDLLCRLQADGVAWWVGGLRPGSQFEGDGGPAKLAKFRGSSGLAVDSMGNIFVADAGNRRIRKLTPVP